jgi:hypothetical protein
VLNNEDPVRAAVFNARGVYPGGWCGPAARFDVGLNSNSAIVELRVWMGSKAERETSRLSVTCSGRQPVEFDVPHACIVNLQVACPGNAGDVIETVIESDNINKDNPNDRRLLSFRILSVRFS